jgi:DNA-binding CsgD family transcriptional regulator/transposase
MAKVAATRTSEATCLPIAIGAPRRFSAAEADQQPFDLVGAGSFAALKATLSALETPALIVGRRGEIVCSNSAARAFVERASGTPSRGGSATEDAGLSSGDWEEWPIPNAGACAWSLMIWRPAVAPSYHWHLTARQTEILGLVARGMTNSTIAETLGIAVGTVEFHVAAIFDKAGVENRAALIASLIRPKRLKRLKHVASSDTPTFAEPKLEVTPGDHAALEAWLRSPDTSSELALRARIVLASRKGEGVRETARRLGTTVPTVCAWRKRYRMEGIAGLMSRKIPGRPKGLSPEIEQRIVNLTRDPPPEVTRWSAARLARKTGVSESTVLRIWRRFCLRPHRTDRSKVALE